MKNSILKKSAISLLLFMLSIATIASISAKSVDETVYWVKSGKVYHTSDDCRTLSRSKNIKSGTIKKSGKKKACSVC